MGETGFLLFCIGCFIPLIAYEIPADLQVAGRGYCSLKPGIILLRLL